MKTPMQQMHEFLCEELEAKQSWRDYPHIENAILKCEELMEQEKQVIMKAVYDGMGTNFDPNMGRAELYYNETFNTTDR
jgi:hypothetical protein